MKHPGDGYAVNTRPTQDTIHIEKGRVHTMAKMSKANAVVENETNETDASTAPTAGPVAVPDAAPMITTETAPAGTDTASDTASTDTPPKPRGRGRAKGTPAPPSIPWTTERNTVVLSTISALNGQNRLYTYQDIADLVKVDPAFTDPAVNSLVRGESIRGHLSALQRKTEADGSKPWSWLKDVVNVFHKRGGKRKDHSAEANAAKALFNLA